MQLLRSGSLLLIKSASDFLILDYIQNVERNHQKINVILHTAFALLALIMLLDFLVPGKVFEGKNIKVFSEHQDYNNAGGNSHQAYFIRTDEHKFWVESDFALLARDQQELTYAVSRIFKEVNWCSLQKADVRYRGSLRITSGLLIPILLLIAVAVIFKLKKDLGIFYFILQVLLLADLVFLLM